MESELTKTIKQRVHFFKPEMSGNMRTIRFAHEVTTPTGIVDCIRFEDFISDDTSYCRKISPEEKDKIEFLHPEKLDGNCKVEGQFYRNGNCRGCFYQCYRHEIGMLITCYEVKISVADFKNKNGHNFHGHRNYYAVPIDIVKKVLPLVEKGVGVLAYYPSSGHMKVVKECERREVGEELQIFLLYHALKKWCDGKELL